MKFFFALFLILSTASSVLAQGPAGGASGAFKFNLATSVQGLYGSSFSQDGSTARRDMAAAGANFTAGLNLSNFFFGVDLGISKWHQLKDVTLLNNTNISGVLTQASVAAGFTFGNFLILLKNPVHAVYSMDVTDSNGSVVENVNSRGALGLSILMKTASKSFLGLVMTSQAFRAQRVQGTEIASSENASLQMTAYGLTYGWYF